MAVVSTESSVTIDLAAIAKALGLPAPRVEAVVRLLDEENTVPFITRYRKDQTGGLDEEQIRQIQDRVVKQRLLLERKQTILRSIESQGKLTPDLAAAIQKAETTRRLEDLYLPYKPKKQTLATVARSRGLEPLALEILNADPLAADLDARLKDFVNPDKQVPTPADALLGAGHILAEIFSERADFRGRIRVILEKSGRLISSAVEPEAKAEGKEKPEKDKSERDKERAEKKEAASAEAAESNDQDRPLFAGLSDEPTAETPTAETTAEAPAEQSQPAQEQQQGPEESTSTDAAMPSANDAANGDGAQAETASDAAPPANESASEPMSADAGGDVAVSEAAPAPEAAAATPPGAKRPRPEKKKKKKQPLSKAERKAADLQRAFRDYFQYSEAVGRVPPHRVLAINRGEKIKVLRVKIEGDLPAMERVVDEMLIPPGHPHAEFLRGCGRDALQRLVLPSLERELRREMTDAAELHAVEVFAKNLRNLLLQPPVRERRLLALDPGFKSGCKYVALDEFGNLLEHGVVFVVGNAERRTGSKTKLVEVVKNHNLSVIVIGNGTACRETENLVSDLLTNELAGAGVSYVIVSESGASVYSASPLGREEFPEHDATVRGAASIGRRLQDPLSELVKIEPASLGVGLYQHDVKAKHLRDSLDGVVESCVNYVGVDLNTASPSLLRYVSGLNQLTAQRIYDHRKEHGPFRSRKQLKEVSGIGEGTFVQAAGFLKITGGDDPLDTTWIHPESYPVAEKLLEQLGAEAKDLGDKEKIAKLAERARGVDLQRTSLQLKIGTLTLHDIIAQLTRPGRDPREGLPPPIFKQGILKLDDLQPGMELRGTVLNVVDFGAFVDIGLKDSGLVHISQLAGKYVKDPHEVVSVGDIVKVWVLEVDKQRRRVSLTMIPPGTKREEPPHDASRGGHGRPEGEGRGRFDRPAGGQAGGRGRGEGGPGRGGPDRGGQGRGGDGGRRFGGKPQDGRRGDRRPPREAEAQPEQIVEKKPTTPPPPPKKLTKAKLQGRAYLQSFGELTQFLTVPKEPEVKPAAPAAPPASAPAPAASSEPAAKAEKQQPPADGSANDASSADASSNAS
jgi:transcriptional accessory protein Tex/SPT6